ncbi:lytic murein transglycosylase [Gammaproteobacteria bacterium]|nr:lytic murein transglycosylase [Gammaproteobacteria bacterium]
MTKQILAILLALITTCHSQPASGTMANAEQFDAFAVSAKNLGISQQTIDKIGAMKINQEALYKIAHPAEARSWEWYKQRLLTSARVKKGLLFQKKFQHSLNQAQNEYGVPSEYITSILGIESLYGEKKGSFLVPEALATIGFYYPKRSQFFLSELHSLLKVHEDQHLDIFSLKGSYAGAFGMNQFMPDSYQDYAVSPNHTAPDLMNSFEDSILSTAHFLSKKGKWQRGQPCLNHVFKNQPHLQAQQLLNDRHILWLSKTDPRFKTLFSKKAEPNVTGILLTQEKKGLFSAWLTYPNYHAIKTYNVSDMYALLTHLLAEKIHG